jgi:hypothetical protein
MTVIIIITPTPTPKGQGEKTPKVITFGKKTFSDITNIVRAVQAKYLTTTTEPISAPAPVPPTDTK